MNSALGDYVHLRASNYLKFGTNRNGTNNTYNYINARQFLNQRLGSVKTIKNQGTIDELSRRLAANTSQKMDMAEQKWKRTQQRFIDQILKIIIERAKNVTGERRQQSMATGKGWVTISQGNSKKPVQISTTQQWASSMSHAELMQIRKKARVYFREMQNLVNEINKNKGEVPIPQEKFDRLCTLAARFSGLTPENGESALRMAETAVKEGQYLSAYSHVAGAFGEMLVAACDDKAVQTAHGEMRKFLQQRVVGNKTSDIYVSYSDLVTKPETFKKGGKDDRGVEYRLGQSKDKVDVQIKINDEEVFANVKSYTGFENSTQRVSLVEGTPFLSALIYLNNVLPNFGNHWLNFHAMHKRDNASLGFNTSNMEEADQIVKTELAFEALSSGNALKQNTKNANVFVYINRATGQVYVKTVAEILQDLSRFGGSLNSISDWRIRNDFQVAESQEKKEAAITTRLSKILGQLHGKKISISYRVF